MVYLYLHHPLKKTSPLIHVSCCGQPNTYPLVNISLSHNYDCLTWPYTFPTPLSGYIFFQRCIFDYITKIRLFSEQTGGVALAGQPHYTTFLPNLSDSQIFLFSRLASFGYLLSIMLGIMTIGNFSNASLTIFASSSRVITIQFSSPAGGCSLSWTCGR